MVAALASREPGSVRGGFTSQWVKPPTGGGKVQSENQTRTASGRVPVVCLAGRIPFLQLPLCLTDDGRCLL